MSTSDRSAPESGARAAAAPDVSVCIPAWRTPDLLRACLRSVLASRGVALEVRVAEDAGGDGSADLVAREFPSVWLHAAAENEGFSRACNRAAEGALGRHLLFLNADAEVPPDAVARLAAFLDGSPGHAAVAPRLADPDGSDQPSCHAFPGPWTPLFHGTPLQRWWPRSPELARYELHGFDAGREQDVEQPAAACLLVRAAAFRAAGGFDERLRVFFSDVELCRRLAEAGGRVRYLPDVVVRHRRGASTAQLDSFAARWHRDRLAYYRLRHGRLAGAWVKACTVLAWADWAARQLVARLRGRPAEPLGPLSRALWRHLWS